MNVAIDAAFAYGDNKLSGINPVSASVGKTTLFSFNLAKTYQKFKTKCRNA